MKPTSFKEVNKVLEAGDNPNTDQLPVCIAVRPLVEGAQVPFCLSKWKISDEELEKIIRDKTIYISVMGGRQRPIMPMAGDPFKDHEFVPIDKM